MWLWLILISIVICLAGLGWSLRLIIGAIKSNPKYHNLLVSIIGICCLLEPTIARTIGLQYILVNGIIFVILFAFGLILILDCYKKDLKKCLRFCTILLTVWLILFTPIPTYLDFYLYFSGRNSVVQNIQAKKIILIPKSVNPHQDSHVRNQPVSVHNSIYTITTSGSTVTLPFWYGAIGRRIYVQSDPQTTVIFFPTLYYGGLGEQGYIGYLYASENQQRQSVNNSSGISIYQQQVLPMMKHWFWVDEYNGG
jgi:hypothetical protein